MSVRQFKFHINSFKRCKKQSSFARARRRQPSFENTGFTVTHIISDSLDKKPLVLKRRTAHCPHWNPSGREGQSNQAAVFHCERREGTETYPRDPSVGFRGQMRCKSIKREFVSQSQTRWEPLPCHSGAANFPYGPRSLMRGLKGDQTFTDDYRDQTMAEIKPFRTNVLKTT